jgi:glycerophosphoryl diester phosphodiesterase
MSSPIVVAHRGGGGLRPENTLAAFDHAVGLGCTFLELDVHLSKDGVPVVIHDARLERTTDGSGHVSSYSASELQEFDAGYRWSEDGTQFPFRGQGIVIPTLREVFERYSRSRISIDLKHPSRDLCRSVAELISSFGREELTIVGSFSCRSARAFRRMSPYTFASACPNEVRRMVAASRLGIRLLAQSRAGYLMVPEYWKQVHITTDSFVRMAGELDKMVLVWTVNDIETANRLVRAGVDGLITDYPARMMTAFASPKRVR